MDEQRIEAAAKFWVVERFEDGNGRSLGYWTGHNSRDFTPNIIDAMQFVRRDDALLAKSPWHWRDCEATEHKFIGVRAASPHLAPDDGVADVAEQLLIRAANDIGESQMAEPSYSNEGNRRMLILNADLMKRNSALEAALRVAREGYVSIEDVEKAIREVWYPCLEQSNSLPLFLRHLRSRIRHPDSAPSPAKQPLAPATDGEEEVVERMCKAYDDCTECRPNFHYSSMTDALHVANEARDAKWAAWGIIEVAVRNPSVKRWDHHAPNGRSEMAELNNGRYVSYTDYAALEAAAREARDALVIAEIALCNCVPVVPYKGDGPLVKLRETLAHLDRVMGGK